MSERISVWVALSALVLAFACSSSESASRTTEGAVRTSPRIPSGTSAAPEASASSAIGGGQPNNDQAAAGTGAPSQVTPPPDTGLGECGMIQILPDITYTPGNLLVIFDRSISMSDPFPNRRSDTSRLHNAREAIKTALQPLTCPDETTPDSPACNDPIKVALLTFPTYDGVNGLSFTGGGPAGPPPMDGSDAGMMAAPRGLSCTVDGLESDEQIPWQRATEFVAAFDPFWDSRMLIDGAPFYNGMHPLIYGTPISVAFARADEALMDTSIVGNKAVLFLTDGEETGDCMGGDVIAFAQKWHDMGIKTHVVSLAEAGGQGQAFNDMVAMAGGTMQSLYPADSTSLTAEISSIVVENRGSVMCEVTIQDAKLTHTTMACEGGRVLVQSTKVPCDQVNKTEGFYVKDEQTFVVVGSYCETLQAGEELQADFPCELIAPD